MLSIGQRVSGRLAMVSLGKGFIVEEVQDGIERQERLFRFRPDNGDGGTYPLYESEMILAS